MAGACTPVRRARISVAMVRESTSTGTRGTPLTWRANWPHMQCKRAWRCRRRRDHELWEFGAQPALQVGPGGGQAVLGDIGGYELPPHERAGESDPQRGIKRGAQSGEAEATNCAEAHIIFMERTLEEEANVARKAPDQVTVGGRRRRQLSLGTCGGKHLGRDGGPHDPTQPICGG